MSMAKGLNTFLEANISTGDRCYLIRLKQGVELPALRFVRVTAPRLTTHDKDAAGEGLVLSSWQIDIYADDYDDIETISGELHTVLDNYKGSMGEVSVEAVLFEDERDLERPEIGAYRRAFDYTIHYKE